MPYFQNVPSRNKFFSGREVELNEIATRFSKTKSNSLTVCVCGLSGMGKTQIVKEFAYRFQQQYELIWWIDAETCLQESYIKLAEKLDIEIANVDFLTITKLVKESLRNRPNWLLIFDNLKSVDDFAETYLPEQHTGTAGHILMTTCNRNFWPLAQSMVLGAFESEEATTFLLNVTNKKNISSAEKLAKRLGFFPLALSYAAAYIDAKKIKISEYLKMYQKKSQEIFEFELTEDAKIYTDNYSKTVKASLALSFDKIKEEQIALDLMFFCGFIGPDKIPKFLVEKFLRDRSCKLDTVIRVLGEYALIRRDKVAKEKYGQFNFQNSYSIHRLVQEFIVEQVVEDDRPTWINISFQAVYENFKPEKTEPSLWQQAAELVVHLDTVLGWSEKYVLPNQLQLRTATFDMLRYANARDLIDIASNNFSRLRTIYVPKLDEKNKEDVTFYASYLSAWIEICIGRRATSEEFQEVIQAVQQTFSKNYWQILGENSKVVHDLNYSLGTALLEVKQYAKAEMLLKAALLQAIAQADSQRALDCYYNLGSVFFGKRQYGVALEHFKCALLLHEKRGRSFSDVGYAYNAIGYVYSKEAFEDYNLDAAKEYFLKSIDELDDQDFVGFSKGDRYAGWAFYGLARVFCKEGNCQQAELYRDQFKAKINKVFPEQWPETYLKALKKLQAKIEMIFSGAPSSLPLVVPVAVVPQIDESFLPKQVIVDLLKQLESMLQTHSTDEFFTKQQLVTIQATCDAMDQMEKDINLYKYIFSNLELLQFGIQYFFGDSGIFKQIKINLGTLANEGMAYITSLCPQAALEEIDFFKEQERYQEQLNLENSEAFKDFLVKLVSYAAEKRFNSKVIFISYARPMGDLHQEAWTKDFVLLLAKHLISAGQMVYLDQIGSGKLLYGFITEKIEKADHILVICDRTMNYEFNEDGFSGACFEYVKYIDCYRRERKPRFIMPICLNEKSNTPGLVSLFAEVSVYKEGYLDCLKVLIKNTYGFGQEFEDWWKANIPKEIIEKNKSKNESVMPAFNQHALLGTTPTQPIATPSSSSTANNLSK